MWWVIGIVVLVASLYTLIRSAEQQRHAGAGARRTPTPWDGMQALIQQDISDALAALDGNAYYCALVGEEFDNRDGTSRQDVIDGLQKGDPVVLVREPNNIHDRNAVLVTARGRGIGYLPRNCAHIVAQWMDSRPGKIAGSIRLIKRGIIADVAIVIGFGMTSTQIPSGWVPRLEDEI